MYKAVTSFYALNESNKQLHTSHLKWKRNFSFSTLLVSCCTSVYTIKWSQQWTGFGVNKEHPILHLYNFQMFHLVKSNNFQWQWEKRWNTVSGFHIWACFETRLEFCLLKMIYIHQRFVHLEYSFGIQSAEFKLSEKIHSCDCCLHLMGHYHGQFCCILVKTAKTFYNELVL